MNLEPESIEDAVEQFLARRRRGERVDAAAFAAQHSRLGSELSSALDALLALERATTPSDPDDEVPAQIGPYCIVREIGRGGMGVVLEAVEEPLGRRVALKVLPAELLMSSSARARFRREAELAARLDHSGIATIYGAGVEDARPWIAMRYVDGITLSRAVADARAERRACVHISGSASREPEVAIALCLARVAHALHAAHEQGVVHRDVKPSNIIVSSDGTPVLLDFGLAMPEESDGRSLTRTGDTAGTPAYIAPEQLSGERVRCDAQSDVYALGVTLYECLVLRRPFEAPTPVALYRAIAIGDATSVRALNRDVSRDLAVVVSTAMERDRSRRYASAAALAADLEAAGSGRPIAARPVPLTGKLLRWARREPRQAVLASLLVAATIALALFGGTWWASRDKVYAAEHVAWERERDQALAAGYMKLQENTGAESEFLRVEALDPGNLEALAGRALVELERDHDRAALDLLADAPKTPGFEAVRQLCRKAQITQDAECLASQTAPALDPFLVGVALKHQADRGPLSQEPADQLRALRMLDEAVARSPYARPLIHTARALAAAYAHDERATRSAVAALLVLWPDSGQILQAAGTALYHFDLAAAEPLLVRATELAPDDSASYQVLGNVHQQMDDPEGAEYWLWRALARRRDGETYNSMGIALASRGCIDEARSAWWRGIALEPWNQNCWLNLGQASYLAHDFELGRFALEHLLQRDPNDLQAIGMLGSVLYELGDFQGTRAQFSRVLELDPKRSNAWKTIALADQALGKKSEAREAVEFGLSFSPGDEGLTAVRAKLGLDD